VRGDGLAELGALAEASRGNCASHDARVELLEGIDLIFAGIGGFPLISLRAGSTERKRATCALAAIPSNCPTIKILGCRITFQLIRPLGRIIDSPRNLSRRYVSIMQQRES